MNFLKIAFNTICLGLSLGMVAANGPVFAQKPTLTLPRNCEWLKEVSTQQTQIRKTIQAAIINDANWNTDFAVPTGKRFKSYVGKMIPENDAAYETSINLKYNDGTSDVAYQRNVPMKRWQVYSLPFRSATNRQPYQINLRIGGDRNNVYTIAVMACR